MVLKGFLINYTFSDLENSYVLTHTSTYTHIHINYSLIKVKNSFLLDMFIISYIFTHISS